MLVWKTRKGGLPQQQTGKKTNKKEANMHGIAGISEISRGNKIPFA